MCGCDVLMLFYIVQLCNGVGLMLVVWYHLLGVILCLVLWCLVVCCLSSYLL